jgi:hypothetical protein
VRKFKFSKKAAAIGLAFGIALGAGGIAAAYFTASGSGSDKATVGTSTNWTYVSSSTVGKAYPGHGTSVVTYTFKNVGHGDQAITSSEVSSSIASTGGNIVETVATVATPVPGCSASWFSSATSASNPTFGKSVAPTGTTHVSVTVTMNNGTGATGSNQDACKTATPQVKITIAA